MPSVSLRKTDGSEAGAFELLPEIFDAPQNGIVVREALNSYLANQRQGTHSTKTRGFVSGGGKKPWKQKGTGRARCGSNRSPLWRGGANLFGPLPRDYREKTNRRKRQVALRAVLSARRESGSLIVLDKIDLSAQPKTRVVVEILGKLNAKGRVLFVTDKPNAPLFRAASNIPYVEVTHVGELNTYQILVADTVILSKDAVNALQEAAK